MFCAQSGDTRTERGAIGPLFQRRIYRAEFSIEGAADTVDGSDDHNAEADGNQTILDRCRTGFVAEES